MQTECAICGDQSVVICSACGVVLHIGQVELQLWGIMCGYIPGKECVMVGGSVRSDMCTLLHKIDDQQEPTA